MKRALLAIVLVGCVKTQPDGHDAGAGAVATSTAAVAAPTSTSLGVTDCESMLVDAEKKAGEARAAASTQCKTDDDCTLVESGVCVAACADRAIAKNALPAYVAVRDALKSTTCRKWTEAECPKTTPKPAPACKPQKAACTGGTCVATGS